MQFFSFTFFFVQDCNMSVRLGRTKEQRNIAAKIQFCFFPFLLTLKIIIEKKINYMFDIFYCLLYNIYLFSALIKKDQRFSRSMIHLIRIRRGNSRFCDLHGLKFTLVYVSCHFRKIMKLFIGLLYYVICNNISFIWFNRSR